MKKIMLVSLCLGFAFSLSAQINPVTNLTYDQWYHSPNTYFHLEWNSPNSSQNNLVGYNVYRGNDLYRFQTDTIVCFTPPTPEPCDNTPGDFLNYSDEPFWIHVTAVYNQNHTESIYTDSVQTEVLLIGLGEIKNHKRPFLYPNPTTGKLNIDYKNIQQILIFGLNGKLITKFKTSPQIDLSGIPKGLYFVKLINGDQSFLRKLVLE